LGIGDILGEFFFAIGNGLELGIEAGDVLLASTSSVGNRTVRPVSAVRTPFREDAALPSSVLGPVESLALAWFAGGLSGTGQGEVLAFG
jgi:hypothetical protein